MLLDVKDLHVAYGPIEALHGVNFHVKEGEIVTLIGANGAGKSTTLMSIMRLPPPEAPVFRSGRMTFQGQDLTKFRPMMWSAGWGSPWCRRGGGSSET